MSAKTLSVTIQRGLEFENQDPFTEEDRGKNLDFVYNKLDYLKEQRFQKSFLC